MFNTLHHFESRINQEDEPSAKEAAFKTISKHEEASISKQKGKTHSCNNTDDEEFQSLLARTLPRGSGKYKGKLPLKCFSCGNIGHYARNCPYAKNVENENSSRKFRSNRKFINNEKKVNRNFLSKDCDSSNESDDASDDDSDSENDSDSEPEKLLFKFAPDFLC